MAGKAPSNSTAPAAQGQGISQRPMGMNMFQSRQPQQAFQQWGQQQNPAANMFGNKFLNQQRFQLGGPMNNGMTGMWNTPVARPNAPQIDASGFNQQAMMQKQQMLQKQAEDARRQMMQQQWQYGQFDGGG